MPSNQTQRSDSSSSSSSTWKTNLLISFVTITPIAIALKRGARSAFSGSKFRRAGTAGKGQERAERRARERHGEFHHRANKSRPGFRHEHTVEAKARRNQERNMRYFQEERWAWQETKVRKNRYTRWGQADPEDTGGGWTKSREKARDWKDDGENQDRTRYSKNTHPAAMRAKDKQARQLLGLSTKDKHDRGYIKLDAKAIKKAFQAKAKSTHPDVAGGCNVKFQQVNDAYQHLLQQVNQ